LRSIRISEEWRGSASRRPGDLDSRALVFDTAALFRPRWFAPWSGGLLAAWTATWVVYQRVFAARLPLGSWRSLGWWTGAKVLVWIVPPLWMLWREGQRPDRATGLDTVRGLARGALLVPPYLALQIIWSAMRHHWPGEPRFGAGTVNACLVAPLFEELVFRGFVLHRLRRSGVRFLPASVSTTTAFALLHVPGWLFMNGATSSTLLSLVNVAAVGMVLAAVAWRLPSLWCAVLLHAVHNAWDQGVILAAVRAVT
jgi:membrane protease YdiL (CAAX protease family)